MQGKIDVDADLSTIPFENLALLLGGVAVLLILAALVIVFVVKKLGFKNIGNIQLEQRGQSTLYSMTEAAKDTDDICKRQMRYITGNIKIHVSNIFTEMNICPIARVAIASTIRLPLFESVANNHFTTELMPDHYDAYKNRIIEMIKDEYVSLAAFSKEVQCARDTLPQWDDVKIKLLECIDLWIRRISIEVMRCCEKKVIIYQKYLKEFEEVKDTYRAGIVKNLLEKNLRYIDVLKMRIK